MAQMKEKRKHYFTVEGECEQWYLQWLQNKINNEPASIFKVTLDCQIQKGIKNILCNDLVIIIEEGDTYRFLHKNFRDYFAAVHITIISSNRIVHYLENM